jgi:hypothetical protein
LWGGDAIYGESVTWVFPTCLVLHSAFGLLTIYSLLTLLWHSCDFDTVKWKEVVRSDFSHAEGVYAEQLGHAGYRALLDRNVTGLGAMDDHDYGTNNGDSRFNIE